MDKFRHLVVEGPIGAGKTTLARRLAARLSADLVLEQPAENPFLSRFYQDMPRYALPTQLFFLFQRARMLEPLAQPDMFGRAVVADFLLDKDPLFARITLSADELALYLKIYEALRPQAPGPDLVIYLQAPIDVLLERIERRGIRYEQHIEREYLEKLQEAYARFFHDYDASPLLIVNAAQADFISNERDYLQLLEQVQRIRRGRHYYNPLPGRD